MNRRQILIAGLSAFVSCKKSDSSSLRLQLNWLPEAEHGGYYQALAEKLFEKSSLRIEIHPGASGMPVETEVASGRSAFGVIAADKLLQVQENGLRLRPLLAPIKHSPRCLLVRQDSPVRSFDSVKEAKTLSLNTSLPFWKWLCHRHPELQKSSTVAYNQQLFLGGQADLIQGYANSEPILFEAKKVKCRSLLVSDTGFDPYAAMLVCSENLAKTQPELVQAVTDAARLGWLSYLQSPAPAHALIAQQNPAVAEHLEASAAALKPFCDKGETFGAIDPERMKKLASQLRQAGVLKKDS
ncbi:MAG: hypothetical protein RL095_2339 [Verrucomicrobiota bacterium]|jgi:NitT/TauT family transport system substrate-binding protein